jgi:hypothetical protein
MAVIIRYIWPAVGDGFLCAAPHHDGGIWQNGCDGGRERAIRFESEAEAKTYLIERKYDLPPMKTVFERVPL